MRQFKGFFFDLDGTIYAGTKLLDGAMELLDTLQRAEKSIAFMTNNSTLNAATIARKLQSFGIHADQDQIICPTDLAGSYLTEKYGRSRVYTIGSEHLTRSVLVENHSLSEGVDDPCDIVLVGRDLDFTYQKLEDAVLHLQRGAKLVATNLDFHHPIDTGEYVPETGAIVAAIQKTVHTDAEVIGKPASFIFHKGLERFGLLPHQTVIIGDNPMTDIRGGRKAGLSTILLRTMRERFQKISFLTRSTRTCWNWDKISTESE